MKMNSSIKPLVFGVLAFGWTLPSSLLADRLAADDVSATHRTNIPDSVSLTVPEQIQKALVTDPESGLVQLVQFLTHDTEDQFLRAKRIHDWITDNIAYDSDLLLGLSDQGSRKVNDLVRLKRTTCGGFSALFMKMATLAGLKTEIVTGNSKTCWIKSSKRDCHHVWNAVNIQGKWYYVDTTADGRFTYKHGAFTPKKVYHDVFLFIKPQAKLLINLPLEERQQFLSNAISREQFSAMPRVTVLYHKHSIEYDASTLKQFREGRRDFEGGSLEKLFDVAESNKPIFGLNFKAPLNVLFFPQIVPDTSESFDDSQDANRNQNEEEGEISKSEMNLRAFCVREKSDQVSCSYTVPRAGRYKVYLQAREAGDTRKFGLVHAFTLIANQPGPILPDVSGKLFSNSLLDFQRIRISGSDFAPVSGFPWIEVSRSDSFVTSVVYGTDGKTIPGAVLPSFRSHERIRFYYRLPDARTYFIKLQTRIPDQPGGSMQNLAIVRLDAKGENKPFPPMREMILTRAFVESGLSFLDDTLANEKGDVTLRAVGKRSPELGCMLYDASGKAIPRSCSVTQDGDTLSFRFSVPPAGRFGGRVYLTQQPDTKILAYFQIMR
ncbi:MAG: hypothetical protein K8S54_11585 [Spirochaetia bacterium]|nr:hypothetical protein [Spirochaetia bacterium]